MSPEEKQVFVEHFANCFVNRSDAYYQQRDDGGYLAVYKPLTIRRIADHLQGSITLSLPAVSAEGTCKWLAFDSDYDDGYLDRLESMLSEHFWSCFREAKRAGRAGHLWLPFSEPLPAVNVRALGKYLLAAAGVPNDTLELFPKQASPDKLGSALRLPLGINRKASANGARGWFEHCQKESIIAQLEWFYKQRFNDVADVTQLAEQARIWLDKRNTSNVPPRPATRLGTGNKLDRLNVFDYVDARRQGSISVAQCPLCAAEGHDRHRDNLIIWSGENFACCFQGPHAVHKVGDICRYLRQMRGVVAS